LKLYSALRTFISTTRQQKGKILFSHSVDDWQTLKMTTSRKLKIWILATHALIVVGFGHGILFFFIIEIVGFPFVTKSNFSFLLNVPFESRLPMVGLTSLCGQIMLLVSIVSSGKTTKFSCQIIGLVLLWLSIVYFTWTINHDDYVHFATITALPFCICTIITFAGQPIGQTAKKISRWARDNY
jgi:hypothetical protein